MLIRAEQSNCGKIYKVYFPYRLFRNGEKAFWRPSSTVETIRHCLVAEDNDPFGVQAKLPLFLSNIAKAEYLETQLERIDMGDQQCDQIDIIGKETINWPLLSNALYKAFGLSVQS